jgi:hypothetical protein
MAQAKQRPPGGKRQSNQGRANRATPSQPTASQATAPPPVPPKNQPTESQQKQSAIERRAQRAAEAKRQQQRRQMRFLLIGLGVASVVAVAAFFFIREQLALQNVGVAVPIEDAGHVNDGEPLTYQHYPPSSGKHYPSAQPPGVYNNQEINEGYWLHSLEHGYIAALVKCTDNCGPIFEQLEDIYENDLKESAFGNVKFVATKYSKPYTDGSSPTVMLTAWGYEMEVPITNGQLDRQAIERFYNKFVDKGPENVP